MSCFTISQLARRKYANQLVRTIARPRPAATMASPAPLPTQSLPDITAPPTADQHILHHGKEYTTIKEGLAYILVPATAPKIPQATPRAENKPQDVFYNPIQQFNRDLSVLAIKAYGEQLLEKRKVDQEGIRKKLKEKKNKKRKREEDGNEATRKAGKLDPSTAINENQDLTLTESAFNGHEDSKDLPLEDPLGREEDNVESNGATGVSTTATQPGSIKAGGADDSNPIAGPDNNMLDVSEVAKEAPSAQRPVPFTILDALSATGLRALRYSHEIPFTTSVTANDLLPEATKTIKLNIKHNKLEHKITATTSNAMSHMYSLLDDSTRDARNHPQWSRKYNVIDLDPYGTAAPFLDAAVQAVRDDGGLLCVTCTDAGVWASNGYPEKCYALYGGTPIKGQHSHEGGLRLILHAIATSAARYGLAMQPLLSLSIDFYARVFVRIHRSPAEVKFLAGKTMMVYNCDGGCGAWTTQMVGRNKLAKSKKGSEIWKHQLAQGPTTSEKCEHCGFITHIAGPMYAGPLHDPVFIKRILDSLPTADTEVYKTTARIEGMLSVALEECLPPSSLPESGAEDSISTYEPAMLDPAPFHFLPSALSKVIHCVTPVENAVRGALRGLGYRVTRSHTKAGSIKTDAPWSVVWEVMREWVKQKSPVKEGAIREGTPGWKILGLGDGKTVAETSTVVEKQKKSADAKEVQKGENGEAKKKLNVVFDESLGREKDTKKLVRYQINPRENWGPMARAKGKA